MKTDILGQLLEAVIKSEGQDNKSTHMLVTTCKKRWSQIWRSS